MPRSCSRRACGSTSPMSARPRLTRVATTVWAHPVPVATTGCPRTSHSVTVSQTVCSRSGIYRRASRRCGCQSLLARRPCTIRPHVFRAIRSGWACPSPVLALRPSVRACTGPPCVPCGTLAVCRCPSEHRVPHVGKQCRVVYQVLSECGHTLAPEEGQGCPYVNDTLAHQGNARYPALVVVPHH